METISGSGNWRLLIRREGAGVTILRAVTCDAEAVLPGTLFHLPVTALGDRALSPDAAEPFLKEDSFWTEQAHGTAVLPGEAVQILCGRGGTWNNSALRTLSLPPTLRRVGNYALYNCRALERLRLYDNRLSWGGGVFLNCGNLGRVELLRTGEDRGTLAFLAGELNQELDVSVHNVPPESDRIRFRLIFPEYRETYEENSPAHHFDYVIEGCGYPYRRCFRDRQLDLAEYDRLWPGLLKTASAGGRAVGGGLSHLDFRDKTVPGGWFFNRDSGQPDSTRRQSYNSQRQSERIQRQPDSGVMTALHLAWWRLRYPEGLARTAKNAYLRWISLHAPALAAWLIGEGDVSGLRFFLKTVQPEREVLQSAAALARERRNSESVALLLEELHERFPTRAASRFAL